MLVLDEEDGLENAGLQVAGATRSTIVNLFHLDFVCFDPLMVSYCQCVNRTFVVLPFRGATILEV